MTDFALNQSLQGRIANLPLAPSPENAMVPVYEAIMNALQSIEERMVMQPQPKGRVTVKLVDDDDGRPTGFIISDNGSGMHDDNFESFRTSDSVRKYARGGKGVGRLTWLKVFGGAEISGHHDETDGRKFVSFKFEKGTDRPIRDYKKIDAKNKDTGVTVSLLNFEGAYKTHVPKRTDTIQKAIIRHFLTQIISPDAPDIIFERAGETTNLKEYFEKIVFKRELETYNIEIDGDECEFFHTHFMVSKDFRDRELEENLVFLNGNGRAVEPLEINTQTGLKIIEDEYIYIGIVSSAALDGAVSPERGRFTLGSQPMKDIRARAISAAREYLKPYIEKIRDAQVLQVNDVARVYPRFLNTIGDARTFVEDYLSPSQKSAEDVYIALSLRNYREIRDREKAYRIERSTGLKAQDIIGEKVRKYLGFVSKESHAVLADYMVRRRSIVSVLEEIIGLEDLEKKRNYLEEVVHAVICPLGSTLDELTYNRHNLWVLDDRLAYYNYFLSDVGLKNVVIGSDSSSEPDLAFFDLGLGFQRERTSEPVLIVEFKRPGRDNYTRADNPVAQAIDYIEKIRSGQFAVDKTGRKLSTLGPQTPFVVKIVADITPTLRNAITGIPVKNPTPDGRGLFGYIAEVNAEVEVIPYDKLIDDVVSRHEVFFEKLGIKA
jgi:hypothetical protein